MAVSWSRVPRGIRILIVSSLRRVCATAGLTSLQIALSSGARNQRVGHDVVGTASAIGGADAIVRSPVGVERLRRSKMLVEGPLRSIRSAMEFYKPPVAASTTSN